MSASDAVIASLASISGVPIERIRHTVQDSQHTFQIPRLSTPSDLLSALHVDELRQFAQSDIASHSLSVKAPVLHAVRMTKRNQLLASIGHHPQGVIVTTPRLDALKEFLDVYRLYRLHA